MIYREYGSTGVKVSALGFGGMRFPQELDADGCAALVKAAYDRAHKIITENRVKLDLIAGKLIEKEVIDIAEARILLGMELPPVVPEAPAVPEVIIAPEMPAA